MITNDFNNPSKTNILQFSSMLIDYKNLNNSELKIDGIRLSSKAIQQYILTSNFRRNYRI